MSLTKAQRAERDTAITQLREWIKPGNTVYTILDHVSASGMSRHIRVVVPTIGCTRCGDVDCNHVDFIHPNYAVGRALGIRHAKRNGRELDALVVGGCGMDMGFHLVYELSSVLYGTRRCTKCHRYIPEDYPTNVTCGECDGEISGGYQCLGKGICSSNYHNNHHDTVRCKGTMVYNPDGPNIGDRCRFSVEARTHVIGVGDCVTPYDQVCPTCAGAGRIPNPEGPERFDLLHTDGYALRHRWL